MKLRILIMDDDPAICRIFTLMLERLGYEGEAVTCGEEILARAEAARGEGRPFDAVILDLNVSEGMGGLETVRALRERFPGIYAIVASGAARSTIQMQYAEQGFDAMLPKPFRIQDVADCLARVRPAPQP